MTKSQAERKRGKGVQTPPLFFDKGRWVAILAFFLMLFGMVGGLVACAPTDENGSEDGQSGASGFQVTQNIAEAGSVTQSAESGSSLPGDRVTLLAQTNPGYTWIGWFEGEQKVSVGASREYTFTVGTDAPCFTARWCKVTLVKNQEQAGTVAGLQGTYCVGDETTVTAATNPGYTWLGWFVGGQKVSEGNSPAYTFTMDAQDKTLTASWSKVTLAKAPEQAGAITGLQGAYCAGDPVTVTATQTAPGYTWLGWYEGGQKVSDGTGRAYTFAMGAENRTLTATWIPCPVTLQKSMEGAGEVDGSALAGATAAGERYIVTATKKVGYVWQGWYVGGDKVSTGDALAYTFVMPEEEVIFTAKWEKCENHSYNSYRICNRCGQMDAECGEILEDGSVLFGSYPQSEVTEEALKGALNAGAGDPAGWASYDYFISGQPSSFMRYTDVQYDGNRYRGVVFDRYRPWYASAGSSAAFSYQDDNGYSPGAVFWFRYDPIRWRVVEQANGEALLLSDLILDSQAFFGSDADRTLDGKTVRPNNYAHSDIRKWLNETFLQTAFSGLQRQLIGMTLVDNSGASTGRGANEFACENTSDKVFLLSYEEATDPAHGFSDTDRAHAGREKQGTAYARCQGLFQAGDRGVWWLRSPSDFSREYACDVSGNGGLLNPYYVCDTGVGVCPALKLHLA